MFLILIISQIVNLKTIWDVLGLKKCYQCGGETLDPVVKHSVSDSRPLLKKLHIQRVLNFDMTSFGTVSVPTFKLHKQ